jgi:hypothetical protein
MTLKPTSADASSRARCGSLHGGSGSSMSWYNVYLRDYARIALRIGSLRLNGDAEI